MHRPSDGRPRSRRRSPGPGGRDGFELVTRAVTDDRYVIDDQLVRPELGPTRQWYVFAFTYRQSSATLVIRDGFVTEKFIVLARKQGRSGPEEAHLAILKQELADRLMASAAYDVYDVDLPIAADGPTS